MREVKTPAGVDDLRLGPAAELRSAWAAGGGGPLHGPTCGRESLSRKMREAGTRVSVFFWHSLGFSQLRLLRLFASS
jgi:hypothetical protein